MLKVRFIGGIYDGWEVAENASDPAIKAVFEAAIALTKDNGDAVFNMISRVLQDVLASDVASTEKLKMAKELNDNVYMVADRSKVGGDDIIFVMFSPKA